MPFRRPDEHGQRPRKNWPGPGLAGRSGRNVHEALEAHRASVSLRISIILYFIASVSVLVFHTSTTVLRNELFNSCNIEHVSQLFSRLSDFRFRLRMFSLKINRFRFKEITIIQLIYNFSLNHMRWITSAVFILFFSLLWETLNSSLLLPDSQFLLFQIMERPYNILTKLQYLLSYLSNLVEL